MSKRRILVVDDHPVNRRLVELLLPGDVFHVVQADSGDAALRVLEDQQFDVVLLDISMPGMTGEEVLARVFARLGTRAPKMIAYTAHALDVQRQDLMRRGFAAVLTKPINRQALLDAVSGERDPGESPPAP